MRSAKIALGAAVLGHLGVTATHGAAHVGAHIPLGAAAMAFVILVIQIGPLAGLLYMRARPLAGALVITTTMSAALVFGLVNHFVLPGADHVAHVDAGWQLLFASTAVLLFVTEAAGVILGMWYSSLVLRLRWIPDGRQSTPRRGHA